ncbi:hypothetical protein AB0H83_16555 [Dactylosporangium sp. NPDC050688]|uniref:hypothetical protein n=1 Tax=Dactylosporangium sp. NPDC050688 TaxID=3157217 RepID=UPI0033DAC037
MTEIDPAAGAAPPPAPDGERAARARRRLDDAGARVTAEARAESREQVRELMGWS